MQKTLTKNEQTVVAFLKMMENRESSQELEKFYHTDVEQIEFPNAILKATAIRDLQDLKDGSERGKKILSKEIYEVRKLHAIGDLVILEAVWTGILSVPIGNLKTGEKMTAYFAQFFEFKDGKIFRQRNYDCFEPFS